MGKKERKSVDLDKYTVVIPAAGQGRRMNRNMNKQFIEVGGHPVLAWTLKRFEEHEKCEAIVLVVHPNDEAATRALISCYQITKVTHIVHGGKERQDSIGNGLEKIQQQKYVMVHEDRKSVV